MDLRIVALVITVLCMPPNSVCQQIPQLPVVKVSDFADAKPKRCETRVAELDVVHQSTPSVGVISVIARLGDGDTRPNLNQRRLHNVWVYWTEFLDEPYRRKDATIVLVEGDPIKGYGHLEFYSKGELVHVMKVAANSDLFIGECYPPNDTYIRKHVFNACEVKSNKIFYPCRNQNPRRRKAH